MNKLSTKAKLTSLLAGALMPFTMQAQHVTDSTCVPESLDHLTASVIVEDDAALFPVQDLNDIFQGRSERQRGESVSYLENKILSEARKKSDYYFTGARIQFPSEFWKHSEAGTLPHPTVDSSGFTLDSITRLPQKERDAYLRSIGGAKKDIVLDIAYDYQTIWDFAFRTEQLTPDRLVNRVKQYLASKDLDTASIVTHCDIPILETYTDKEIPSSVHAIGAKQFFNFVNPDTITPNDIDLMNTYVLRDARSQGTLAINGMVIHNQGPFTHVYVLGSGTQTEQQKLGDLLKQSDGIKEDWLRTALIHIAEGRALQEPECGKLYIGPKLEAPEEKKVSDDNTGWYAALTGTSTPGGNLVLGYDWGKLRTGAGINYAPLSSRSSTTSTVESLTPAILYQEITRNTLNASRDLGVALELGYDITNSWNVTGQYVFGPENNVLATRIDERNIDRTTEQLITQQIGDETESISNYWTSHATNLLLNYSPASQDWSFGLGVGYDFPIGEAEGNYQLGVRFTQDF